LTNNGAPRGIILWSYKACNQYKYSWILTVLRAWRTFWLSTLRTSYSPQEGIDYWGMYKYRDCPSILVTSIVLPVRTGRSTYNTHWSEYWILTVLLRNGIFRWMCAIFTRTKGELQLVFVLGGSTGKNVTRVLDLTVLVFVAVRVGPTPTLISDDVLGARGKGECCFLCARNRNFGVSDTSLSILLALY
jgi:hypothetical protein